VGSRPDLCSLLAETCLKERELSGEGRARKALCKAVPSVFSARDHRGSVLPIDGALRGTRVFGLPGTGK